MEELYYPCSEKKGTDQLHSDCEADLRLCFFAYAECWFSHAVVHFLHTKEEVALSGHD